MTATSASPAPESPTFAAHLAAIFADARRCALADFDAGRDGRLSDERDGVIDLSIECVGDLGYGPENGGGGASDYWLRCYDQVLGGLLARPAAFASGDRVIVASASVHNGRRGSVTSTEADGSASVDLDPRSLTDRAFNVRWTKPELAARWAS